MPGFYFVMNRKDTVAAKLRRGRFHVRKTCSTQEIRERKKPEMILGRAEKTKFIQTTKCIAFFTLII